MLELNINGKLAQLPTQASIPFKIHNPAFNKLGTLSEYLNLVIEGNRATMQHVEDEANLTEVTQTFVLKLGGEVFTEGDVGVDDTVKSYKSYLKSGKSAIARILKESYLDDSINGESWGEAANGITDINASINGIYPAKQFTVAPVKLDDYTINDWIDGALTTDDIIEGKVTPMVYVRHLIDRINQACNLLVVRNDWDKFSDFNRLCMFSPRRSADKLNGLKLYREWLPHITAADLLKDLEERFNIVAFFSPFGREVAYVHFDDIFTGDIVDWTSKFIRNEKIPPFQEGLTLLKNDGEDEEVLSPREIEEKYQVTEVPTYDDLTVTDYAYKVADVGRYFDVKPVEFDNSLTRPLYFDTLPFGGSAIPYRKLREEVDTGSNSLTNSDTGANVDNPILVMFFPDHKGMILDNVAVHQFEAKVNNGDATLVAKVELAQTINGSSVVIEELGKATLELTNSALELKDIVVPITKSAEFESTFDKDDNYMFGTYLRVSFYCLSAIAGRSITLKLGNVDAPIPATGYTTILADAGGVKHRELGVLGTYEHGKLDAKKVREVEPKSKVLFNDEGRSGGYLFQMPKSDIDPKLEQKDYAYTIYRGLINDERNGGKTAPYCNFDVLDNAMKDYQSRVTNGATPDLSLRYHGEKGLARQLHQKRLNWYKLFERPARKVFQLTKNDLQNLKMYDRISVYNKQYVANIISVKAQVNDELSEATVDVFCL